MVDLTLALLLVLWGAVIILWFVHWRCDLKFHRALIRTNLDLASRIMVLEEQVSVLPPEATELEKLRAAMRTFQRSLPQKMSEEFEQKIEALVTELKAHLPAKAEDED